MSGNQKLDWEPLTHSPYFQHVTPSDYYLFLGVDSHLRDSTSETEIGLNKKGVFQNERLQACVIGKM